MIFEIFNNENNRLQNIRKAPVSLVPVPGGITVISDTSIELPVQGEYDNASYYGFDVVVLCKNGKWGAIGFDKEHEHCYMIACCDYDTLDERNHDLVFSKHGEQIYYNAATNSTLRAGSVHFYGNDDSFLLADEGDRYSLWERESGKLLWWANVEDACVSKGMPVLMPLENGGGFPVFQDVNNGFFLAPAQYDVKEGELVVTLLSQVK